MSKDSSARCYQSNKEKLQTKEKERHQEFSKEEKEKRQYGREQYKNLSVSEKQKLVEYRKKIIKWEKIPYYKYKKIHADNKPDFPNENII